jgi:5'-nucleotidase
MEGYLFGISAIAFSQVKKGWEHVDAAALKAKEIVANLIKLREANLNAAPWLLNVNVPNLPFDQLKATKVCRLGARHAAEKVITQTTPHGRTKYWIGGAGPAKDDSEGTDFHAALLGHVTLTPLKTDLTNHETLSIWSQHAEQFAKT